MGWPEETEQSWHAETEAVLSGLTEWRAQHPTATFAEIEAAVDERLDGMRARMLERLALASATTAVSARAGATRPACTACGTRLEGRGRHGRDVVTRGNRTVHLEREYAVCPTCGVGLFPPG